MYRISAKVRLYSPTPIVRVTLDDKGKELEEIVCICQGKKKAGDALSAQIVDFLNAEELVTHSATSFV